MSRKSFLLPVALLLSNMAFADIYLATDKTAYVAGEPVQCSVFSTDGDALAYVQMFDDASMTASTKISLQDGRGGGSLQLPLSIPTGNYRVIAYTASGSSDTFVLPVYNTFSTERRSDVKVVEAPLPTRSDADKANGLEIRKVGNKLIVKNTGAEEVSAYVSVSLQDALAVPSQRCIQSFDKAPGSGANAPEADGEILQARLAGPDAGKIAGLESVTAVLSFPGLKSDVYTCQIPSSGIIPVPTENVFGKRDVACMLYGMPDGSNCHIEVDPKVYSGDALAETIPAMQLNPLTYQDLLGRARALRNEKITCDTLVRSLPVRRPHFLLEKECRSYVLDDYTRFPTMEEEFVEIIKNVRRRRGEDRTRQIQLAITTDPLSKAFSWGTALVMIDGVPIFNHNQVWSYDPSIVKIVETYPYSYSIGYRVYDGVVNFVTYKENLPIISFDDNVRLYDFEGCSYPVEFKGTNTLYWHPLVSLKAGESFTVDCSAAKQGAIYNATSEGITAEGRTVAAKATVSF